VQRNGSGNHRIFNISNSGAVLDGVTARIGLFDTVNGDGAGLYIWAGMVTNCIVKENHITGGPWSYSGGGVAMGDGTLANCVISSNTAPSGGGVCILANGGAVGVIIDRCQITDNSALIYDQVDVRSCGGILALNVNSPYAYMYSSLIARNVGNRQGAGIYADRSSLRAYNCTIVSNLLYGGQVGGGAVHGNFNAELRNCIVYHNVGGKDGNSVVQSGPYPVLLYNTCYTNSTPASQGNITIDASCITADPLLANMNTYDYSLHKTSPCIDTGSNYTWIVTGTTDLAGNARKQYGAKFGSKADPIVDMGAYETYVPPMGTVFTLR
jgi:hypothetical protein